MIARLTLLIILAIHPALAEDPPPLIPLPSGDEILAAVRQALPGDHLQIEAELRVKNASGATERFLQAGMDLNWGAAEPSARYDLRDRFGDPLARLEIRRPPGAVPEYALWEGSATEAVVPDLHASVAETTLTWMDLCFDFLWWPDAQRLEFEEKKGRLCHVVEIPAPKPTPACRRVRLWVDTDVHAILEVEVYGEGEEPARRLKVRSFQKIEEQWTLKDLDAIAYPARRKTTLRVQNMQPVAVPAEMESKSPEPQAPGV